MMPPFPEVSIPCTTRSTAAVPPSVAPAYRRSCRSLSSRTVLAISSDPAALSPSKPGVERGSRSASTNPWLVARARVKAPLPSTCPDPLFVCFVLLAMSTMVAPPRPGRDLIQRIDVSRWKDVAHARASLPRGPWPLGPRPRGDDGPGGAGTRLRIPRAHRGSVLGQGQLHLVAGRRGNRRRRAVCLPQHRGGPRRLRAPAGAVRRDPRRCGNGTHRGIPEGYCPAPVAGTSSRPTCPSHRGGRQPFGRHPAAAEPGP